MTTPTEGTTGARAAASHDALRSGAIAARIDRLPLTRLQYRLAIITQIAWGLVLATDGIAARLFPFLWEPRGMSTFEYSVIIGANTGAGILIGEWIGGFLADRYGRKKIIIASAVVDAVFLWPVAMTDSFGWLLLWNLLFAFGIGFALATTMAYLHEVVPPQHRTRVSLRSQTLAWIQVLIPAVLGYFLIPAHYEWFVWLLAIAQVGILVPLCAFGLPESPRWLEGKGRLAEADRIVTRWERLIERRTGPLPEPPAGEHPVVQTQHVPARELFRGEYGRRTTLLLAVWLLGYPGIVYGLAQYLPTYLVEKGWTAHQLFLFGGGMVSVPIGVLTFYLASMLGERFERKNVALVTGILSALVSMSLLIVDSFAVLAILSLLTTPITFLWLFSMYNYTAAAYPTRLRAVGTGWTDGVGHLATFIGPLLLGPLYAATAGQGHWGWILFVALPCAVLPSVLIGRFGVRQKGAILEQIST